MLDIHFYITNAVFLKQEIQKHKNPCRIYNLKYFFLNFHANFKLFNVNTSLDIAFLWKLY